MRSGHRLIQILVIALFAALLAIGQPTNGQASSSHSMGSSDEISQSMTMNGGDQGQDMTEMGGTQKGKDMPEMAKEDRKHDIPGESVRHDKTNQKVNWPVILSFAGINTAVLLIAAVLRRKKLITREVNYLVGK